jgi:hypothetical protein
MERPTNWENSVHYLYYWRKYLADTSVRPIFKLNQNSEVMQMLRPSDVVWAISRLRAAHYELVARFVVDAAGENAPTDPDFLRHGRFYFVAEPKATRYFSKGPSAEPLIRSLSIRTNAMHLGQSFQGRSAVRQLAASDVPAIETYAATLLVLKGS